MASARATQATRIIAVDAGLLGVAVMSVAVCALLFNEWATVCISEASIIVGLMIGCGVALRGFAVKARLSEEASAVAFLADERSGASAFTAATAAMVEEYRQHESIVRAKERFLTVALWLTGVLLLVGVAVPAVAAPLDTIVRGW